MTMIYALQSDVLTQYFQGVQQELLVSEKLEIASSG